METENFRIESSKGSTLLLSLIIGCIVVCISTVALRTFTVSSKRITVRERNVSALNVAEAGKERVIARLKQGIDKLTPGAVYKLLDNVALNGGKYTVQCSVATKPDTVWIKSVGSVAQERVTLSVLCKVDTLLFHAAPPLQAALTTRGWTSLGGTITIDGRDHAPDGTLKTGTGGVWGIKCANSVLRNGNAQVGGNGIAPVKDLPSGAVWQWADITKFPKTPGEVLGVPDSLLLQFKVGSVKTSLTLDHEIVYIDQDAHFTHLDGIGILICHTDATDAALFINGNSSFKGLVITDKIDKKMNGTAQILGAVFVLSESDLSFDGKGTADILFSAALLDSISKIPIPSKQKFVDQLAWRQN